MSGGETYTLEHPLVVFSHPSCVARPELDEVLLLVSICGAENGLLLFRTEDGESSGTGRQRGGEEGGVLHLGGAIGRMWRVRMDTKMSIWSR